MRVLVEEEDKAMRTGVVLELDRLADDADAADLDLCFDWLYADEVTPLLEVDWLDVEADLTLYSGWSECAEDLECVTDEDGGDLDLQKKEL